jgi:tetratricopeptide (TPR) repeat protein
LSDGDWGNDGYIPTKGIYYQVYAPENPADRSTEASKKMVDDFNKLKDSGWGQISNIKEYHFVFNDKNNGLDIVLESARAQLTSENSGIVFKIFLPIELETVFLGLTNDQIVSLGFDVDQRKAVEISREYLRGLEIELDRGHANFVYQTLNTMREIILSQGDETLLLDFEIIESRTLQRLEKISEAKAKYESLYKQYPKDVRAPLYLAELYLNISNNEENQRLLDEAKTIDASHWLYTLETLVRRVFLKQPVSIDEIDTNSFPTDQRIKSDYYRIYANLLLQSEDKENAIAFIERALHFNTEKISNYDAKIAMEINILVSEKDEKKRKSKIEDILKEIDSTSNKFNASGNIGNRNTLYLNYKKAMLLVQNERFEEFTPVAKDIFQVIYSCYFDNVIDGILTDILSFVLPPKEEFEKLISYFQSASKPISDGLAKKMFLHFLELGVIGTAGKDFFTKASLPSFVELIDNLEKKEYGSFVSKIKSDKHFAVMISIAIKEPDLRKKITDLLPDDGTVNKDKLYLLFEDEAGNLDGAFALLKKMDLSDLSYVESQKFLSVAKKKEAWDFVIIFGEKLLTYEKEPKGILPIKLELFTANLKLQRLQEVIKIGVEILENKHYITLLDEKNKTILLCQTVHSLLVRNNADDNNRSKLLIENYQDYLSDFESNALLASEVYLRQGDAQGAINCVIRGIKLAKRPSPQEYAGLFMVFNHIGNIVDTKLDSSNQIERESFVKFTEDETWYFVGDEDSLDANPIPKEKHLDCLGKKIGDKVVLANNYVSDKKEKTIENILPMEKYIMWQTYHHFQKLSLEGMWDKAVSIEVPQTEDGGIDMKNIIALMETQNKRGAEFFNSYCEQNLPFAMLALSEGGFTEAIGRIQNEQRGFIRMSDGTATEFISQKNIATKVINDKESFYLDGTSAWVLAETGLLNKLHQYIPNLKVPQSVISLMLTIKDKLSYSPGQVGQMYYSKGKIGYSELNIEQRKLTLERVSGAIKLLESNSANVGIISSASKEDVFCEQELLASLCDATILAQRENISVLTEDFLYLHLNEMGTKKPKPPYFSSIALMRVLYEQGHITFEEYLDFFAYLSSYRFRFLQVTTNDLDKAIFGDGIVKVENLKKLNLPLTLSIEYGVDPEGALKLVFNYILKLLIDDSVSSETLDSVFIEIVSTYPTDKDRRLLGKILISSALKAIQENQKVPVGKNTQRKMKALVLANETIVSSTSLTLAN